MEGGIIEKSKSFRLEGKLLFMASVRFEISESRFRRETGRVLADPATLPFCRQNVKMTPVKSIERGHLPENAAFVVRYAV